MAKRIALVVLTLALLVVFWGVLPAMADDPSLVEQAKKSLRTAVSQTNFSVTKTLSEEARRKEDFGDSVRKSMNAADLADKTSVFSGG